jgi:hypothetical protein
MVGSAEAAVPDVDLSYLRLLVACELLEGDFETQALASGKLAARPASLLRQMQADDGAHYNGLSVLMNGAGQPPATADDIEFSYPRGTFATQDSILKLAWRLVTLSLGGYLGAVGNIQTTELRLPLGQIVGNEAQQQSALAPLVGRPVIGSAFAPALPIEVVSAALDEFES